MATENTTTTTNTTTTRRWGANWQTKRDCKRYFIGGGRINYRFQSQPLYPRSTPRLPLYGRSIYMLLPPIVYIAIEHCRAHYGRQARRACRSSARGLRFRSRCSPPPGTSSRPCPRPNTNLSPPPLFFIPSLKVAIPCVLRAVGGCGAGRGGRLRFCGTAGRTAGGVPHGGPSLLFDLKPRFPPLTCGRIPGPWSAWDGFCARAASSRYATGFEVRPVQCLHTATFSELACASAETCAPSTSWLPQAGTKRQPGRRASGRCKL